MVKLTRRQQKCGTTTGNGTEQQQKLGRNNDEISVGMTTKASAA
jgi:hypothetical protein